jgi:hypothetical protein
LAGAICSTEGCEEAAYVAIGHLSCFKRRLELSDWKQEVIDVTPFLCHAHISTIIKSPPATEAAASEDPKKDADPVKTPKKLYEAAGGEETVEGAKPNNKNKTREQD